VEVGSWGNGSSTEERNQGPQAKDKARFLLLCGVYRGGSGSVNFSVAVAMVSKDVFSL
jgi:hypothetical protein